jgi:hypothetical protein
MWDDFILADDINFQEVTGLTGSQAEPRNRYLEALPRKLLSKLEAEPPDMRYQAEPGNE